MFGGWFAEGQGHEIAQGYGLFLWAGVVLYATVAWRVWARRSETATPPASPGFSSPIPPSHLSATSGAGRRDLRTVCLLFFCRAAVRF